MTDESFDVVVIGSGPAGLATSRELKRRGIGHVVLERGDSIAYTWANLYEGLTLHTGKHMSGLPGMALPRSAPLFVPRATFVDYLRAYAARFDLPVRTAWDVSSVERLTGDDPRWRVRAATPNGERALLCRDVIVATGIISNPRIPEIAGAREFEAGGGQLMHSAAYRRPEPFVGKRVLVIGVGNSGGEIASEIANSANGNDRGASVTIAVRSGAHVVPRDIMGIPIQYLARYIRKLPRKAREAVVRAVGKIVEKRRGPPVLPRPSYGPLDAIPLIGFHLVDAIRDGLVQLRGPVERLTSTGARFADGREPLEQSFDVVILATGFTPALAPLGHLIRIDQKGFALRRDRVQSSAHDGLYFVGHNYDSTGGLFNIAQDSRLVARRITEERGSDRKRSPSPITEHSHIA